MDRIGQKVFLCLFLRWGPEMQNRLVIHPAPQREPELSPQCCIQNTHLPPALSGIFMLTSVFRGVLLLLWIQSISVPCVTAASAQSWLGLPHKPYPTGHYSDQLESWGKTPGVIQIDLYNLDWEIHSYTGADSARYCSASDCAEV